MARKRSESDKTTRARKSASFARAVAELKAAEREIKSGEKIMKASRRSLNAAGRVVTAIQNVDKIAAKLIVHGVKGQSKVKRLAAKRGWDK